MSDRVKMALIAAAALIAALSLHIYFSPYQSCVRAAVAYSKETFGKADVNSARVMCARDSE